MPPLSWYVCHYGKIIDDYQKEIDGNYIRQKIYLYEDKYYIDTWCNGYQLLFHEVI